MIIKPKLQPKQSKLLDLITQSDNEWLGFGGARGGAKSHAIRTLALIIGGKYKAQSLIFRRYRQELLDNHVYPLFEKYPKLRSLFNKSEMILSDPNGNPMITFGYAERQEDIYKFQGIEYPLILIDEATQSSQEMIEWLQTSNRDTQNRLPTKAKMVCGMNPGGVGHAFIKRIFVDKKYMGNEDPGAYDFIQAHVWDNVFWVRKALYEQGFTVDDYYRKWDDKQRMEFTLKYSDYAIRLNKLPEELRKAYLFGDWDIFGGMFFKEFSKAKMCITPFLIPTEWRLIGWLDPGYSSPCAFGLLAEDFNGNVYNLCTYYEAGNNPIKNAEAISMLLSTGPIHELIQGKRPDYIVSGRDAFAKRDRHAIYSTEKTFADIFAEQKLYLIPAITDRIPGWWAVKNLMPDKLKIFDKFNEPLVEEMTAVISDDKNCEDIQGKGNDPAVKDHALDGIRYGIMALFGKAKPAEKDPFEGRRSFDVEPEKPDGRNWWGENPAGVPTNEGPADIRRWW